MVEVLKMLKIPSRRQVQQVMSGHEQLERVTYPLGCPDMSVDIIILCEWYIRTRTWLSEHELLQGVTCLLSFSDMHGCMRPWTFYMSGVWKWRKMVRLFWHWSLDIKENSPNRRKTISITEEWCSVKKDSYADMEGE
jgi:hypothetical protein